MEYEKIYRILHEIAPLTEEVWYAFKELLEPLSFKRNEHIIETGAVVNHCYMLMEGIVRVYYNQEGNEYNKNFFLPGMFPTPITALLTNTPSKLSFQALVPSTVVRFSYLQFRRLFEEHRCLESLLLRIMELQWIKKERHDIQMVTNDATANYLIFQSAFPGLENLIPQYHIASYLGITPIQLSRIRAKLVQNNQ